MNKPYFRVRVLCAAAAVVLTALSSTVFVSNAPRELERRITAHAQAAEFAVAQTGSTVLALAPAATSPAG